MHPKNAGSGQIQLHAQKPSSERGNNQHTCNHRAGGFEKHTEEYLLIKVSETMKERNEMG
jgi:hypothetical protein